LNFLKSANYPNFLRGYFSLSVLELFGVLIAILLLPKDTKNAWVFGYSSISIVMLGAGLITVAAFTAIAHKAWRDPEKFINPLQNRNVFLSIFWASLALVLLSFSVYLNLVEFPNSTIQGYINRLAPFLILFAATGFVQVTRWIEALVKK